MDPLTFFVIITIFLFSVVIHEVAHGAIANAMGDPTAKLAGRLTLNPIKHLDPVGSVLVPLFLAFSGTGIIFGWAKPVPVNPHNFRDKKYGEAKSAFAGPGVNLTIALVFGLLMRLVSLFENIPTSFYIILGWIVFINIILAVFNLMPIPPLDGSHILFTFLPRTADSLRLFLERYGVLLLLLFIFFGFKYIYPVFFFLFNLFVGDSAWFDLVFRF